MAASPSQVDPPPGKAPSNSTSNAVLSSQCLPPAAPHYKRHLRPPPPRTQGRQREQFARSEPWERFREHGGARRRRAGEQGCARGGGALPGGENWGGGPPLDHHWRWGGWRLPASTCVLLPQVGEPPRWRHLSATAETLIVLNFGTWAQCDRTFLPIQKLNGSFRAYQRRRRMRSNRCRQCLTS